MTLSIHRKNRAVNSTVANSVNSTVDNPLVVVIPAAGVGKRMLTDCPKQYLLLDGLTILEHTVNRMLALVQVKQVIVVIGAQDEYFWQTALSKHPKVVTVIGGKERVDSVLAGIKAIDGNYYPWVLVHDAARPCVSAQDIERLINTCRDNNVGGLLASPVRDTMKRSNGAGRVKETVDREVLWHALTPQMYPLEQLISAITAAIADDIIITDESSAIEYAGYPSLLVEGSSENIKITRPDDLALAEFILTKQKKKS